MMLGLATATIVASTRIMKKPTIMAHNAFQGLAIGAAAWAPAGPAHVVDALISPPLSRPIPSTTGRTPDLYAVIRLRTQQWTRAYRARCRRRHGGMAPG